MHTSKVRVSWEHGATETGKMETSAFDTLFNFEGPKGGRKGRRRPFLSAEETSIGGEKHASEGQGDFPAEEQRPRKDGGVAQLGEHLPCKQGVDSSILFISTRDEGVPRGTHRESNSLKARNGLIAQAVRAHA